jgi:hypothetical protein
MTEFRSRLGAVVEVILLFGLVASLFRGVLSAEFSAWEADLPTGRLPILEYGVVLAAVLTLLLVARRPLIRQGIVPHDARRSLYVALAGLPFMLTLGGALSVTDWRNWSGALIISGVAVGLLVGAGWLLRDEEDRGRIIALGGVALLLPWAWRAVAGGISGVVLKTAYVYLLQASTEELLFRGYIQTRLNAAYGKPFVFFGVKWGWGIIVTSLLFGAWHVVLRTADPQAWPHGLWTVFAGLLLCYFRERSEGVLASSVLHGVMNYVPLFELF